MLARLPEYIDPLHLADKRGALKGQIPLHNLKRLADLLFDDSGAVAIELFFQREGRLATIDGRLETVLQLRCQNCLEALEWPVNSEVKLGIVTSIEQADKLPEEFEPLMLEGETLLLKDIVEDELLLALPAFPKHQHACFETGHFEKNRPTNKAELFGDEKPSSRENPFSILANLKNTGDS
ncbi:MAG: YceD family protein [Methylovulum sp.]|uniref:YceD family protein n=1 Tax=Methylovulum sp. TaxID=1916980 RepID=UPI00261352F4|nr:YceD family protein [Methylovulum sp.]MDD2723914.1 YceD family protein [Methylovulum sp.]MDD5125243.1 YceD family protein [Methylovulum sp.]